MTCPSEPRTSVRATRVAQASILRLGDGMPCENGSFFQLSHLECHYHFHRGSPHSGHTPDVLPMRQYPQFLHRGN